MRVAAVATVLGILIGSAICYLLLFQSVTSERSQSAQDVTNEIASLAAKESSGPLFNNDLLSLRVTLAKIAELKSIHGITVHDVENRLLTQVGDVEPHPHSIIATTEITQNSNIAGYLSVYALPIKSTQHLNIWMAVFLCLVCVPLVIILIKQAPSDFLEVLTYDPKSEVEAILDDDSEEYIEPQKQLSNQHAVALSLKSAELDTLASVLSETSYQAMIENLCEQIDSVAKLYNADVLYYGSSLPSLLFCHASLEDNSFSALCCGQLLLSLAFRHQSELNLRAQVDYAFKSPVLADTVSRTRDQNPGGYLFVNQNLLPVLDGKVHFKDSENYWREADDFDAGLQKLLDNQLDQLLIARNKKTAPEPQATTEETS
ncbi:hypothetical protein MAH1_03570 [Sessilibacter sp. MAH1]